jgi:WhiB family transcriptional regulator, redox-sensing transcriptional regulator
MFALDLPAAGIFEHSEWQTEARCADGSGTLVELFFSEQIDDINRAKAFCQECAVKDECLTAALDRREPWGVWGGELLLNGKIVAQKRPRGRPPKQPRPVPDPTSPTAWVIDATEVARSA